MCVGCSIVARRTGTNSTSSAFVSARMDSSDAASARQPSSSSNNRAPRASLATSPVAVVVQARPISTTMTSVDPLAYAELQLSPTQEYATHGYVQSAVVGNNYSQLGANQFGSHVAQQQPSHYAQLNI